jgi:hypothetical protein
MPKLPRDMSQYEVPDDDPMTEDDLDKAREVMAIGRHELATRAAGAGMTPMEYIAAGRATANTPTEAQRQGPALPPADVVPKISKITKTPFEVGTPAPVSKVQEWIDSGAGAASFLEGFFGVTLAAPDDYVVEGEVMGESISYVVIDEVASAERYMPELGEDIIDAEVVEDE